MSLEVSERGIFLNPSVEKEAIWMHLDRHPEMPWASVDPEESPSASCIDTSLWGFHEETLVGRSALTWQKGIWTEAAWQECSWLPHPPEGTGDDWREDKTRQMREWVLQMNRPTTGAWRKTPVLRAQDCGLRNTLLGKGTMILVWARAMKKDNRVLWSGRQLWSQQTGRLQSPLRAQEVLSHPWYQLETEILDMVTKRGRKIYMFTGCESQTAEGILWGMRGDSFSIYGFAGRKGILVVTPTQKGTNHTITKRKSLLS